MKRIFFLTIVCVIALSCGISHAGVAGTAHDLTAANVAGPFSFYGTVQVCVFCHTPHGARTDVTATTYWNQGGSITTGASTSSMLLWNRALPSQGPGDSSVTDFYLYDSSTMNSYSGRLNVYTLMCMGCHDGVGAINVVSNYPNDIPDPINGPIPDVANFPVKEHISDAFPSTANPPSPNIGELNIDGSNGWVMHLENDHPVSIDYSAAYTADGAAAFNGVTTGGTSGAYVGGETRVRLFADPAGGAGWYVECESCHDVHNNTAGQEPFLVMSNSGSALCTACHLK